MEPAWPQAAQMLQYPCEYPILTKPQSGNVKQLRYVDKQLWSFHASSAFDPSMHDSIVGLLCFALASYATAASLPQDLACRASFDLGLMPRLLGLRACCACLLAWHGTTLCTERSCGP